MAAFEFAVPPTAMTSSTTNGSAGVPATKYSAVPVPRFSMRRWRMVFPSPAQLVLGLQVENVVKYV
jgi:hypothetical protein